MLPCQQFSSWHVFILEQKNVLFVNTVSSYVRHILSDVSDHVCVHMSLALNSSWPSQGQILSGGEGGGKVEFVCSRCSQ